MHTSTTAREVSRAFSTIREMLVDRGQDVSSLADVSNDDVVALSETKNVFSVDLPSCSMRIVFNMNPKFKMADVKKLLLIPVTAPTGAAGKRLMRGAAAAAAAAAKAAASDDEDDAEDVDDAATTQDDRVAAAAGGADEFVPTQFIVVARERPAQGKGADDAARDVQLFPIKELLYNVSKHEMVPKHEPIRDEKTIQEILKRYRLKSKFQLPLILSSDPMARYLALKPGQLVRIVRPSPSAGTYTLYRCCS